MKDHRNIVQTVLSLRHWLRIIVLLLCASHAYAGVGTTSAEFLLIPVGARPSAMAGAFSGIVDDVYALAYNPAGLGRIHGNEILFMHASWLVDTNIKYTAFAHAFSRGALGISVTYLDAGVMTGRDMLGNKTRDFSASDLAATVGYGWECAERTFAGISGTFIEQKIDDAKRHGTAFDIGILWEIDPDRWYTGVSIQHIGAKLSAYDSQKEQLPTTYRIGTGYYLFDKRLLAVGEMTKIIHDKPQLGIGLEYIFESIIFLRSGLIAGSNREPAVPVMGGIGIRIKDYMIDYSFEPFGELNSTNRISLKVSF